jgi:hypothetical protein
MSDTRAGITPRAGSDAQRAALRSAVEGLGLKRFAFFGTSIEGKIYPDGIEERSGFVLNEDGRIWGFWTGWDDDRQQVVIDEWWEEPVTPLLTSGREYERARRELGLP